MQVPVSFIRGWCQHSCVIHDKRQQKGVPFEFSYFHKALSFLQLNDILFPTVFQFRLLLPLERGTFKLTQNELQNQY